MRSALWKSAVLLALTMVIGPRAGAQIDSDITNPVTFQSQVRAQEKARSESQGTIPEFTIEAAPHKLWYVFSPSIVNAQKNITGAGSLGISQDKYELSIGYGNKRDFATTNVDTFTAAGKYTFTKQAKPDQLAFQPKYSRIKSGGDRYDLALAFSRAFSQNKPNAAQFTGVVNAGASQKVGGGSSANWELISSVGARLQTKKSSRITFTGAYNIYNKIDKEDGWAFGLEQSLGLADLSASTLSFKAGKHGSFTAAYKIAFD